MRRVFGFRTVLEAAFPVAVPVASLALGLGPAAMALLWRGSGKRRQAPQAAPPEPRPSIDPAPAVAVAAAPEPEPEAEPEPASDPERLSREHQDGEAIRDEERTFLLLDLREFAGPDGLLPVDFDGLVRDSFGDLVGSR